MMAPVAAKLFIAQPALPVLLLLLHGSVLPVQDFQRLATTRHCQILRTLHMWSAAGCYSTETQQAYGFACSLIDRHAILWTYTSVTQTQTEFKFECVHCSHRQVADYMLCKVRFSVQCRYTRLKLQLNPEGRIPVKK